ncbi:uncharacterized protein LOC136090697 [Hydra vulgaris]|uniref:Uncharacterized protein LOC136090697 n=1 Tax=Hydra vulgaris TaxID=6087 RepID=A0ABM4DGM7_HYDVU
MQWAVKFAITDAALAFLLKVLGKLFPELPKDPRTLRQTKSFVPVTNITGGQYCHFGIRQGAVKRNPATTSATESDFQREVVRFLCGASDRNGGRKVRQDQKDKQAKKKLMSTSSFPMPLNKEAFFSSEDE